jgi:hypothetical protein
MGEAARLAAAAAALLLAGCAATPPGPEGFSFGVMGDTPYNAAEERRFLAMLARTGDEPLAFVAHVGDFKGGGPCSDALYQRRHAQFDRSAHPLVYTPGDNEWVDCRGAGADALERLARLREVFFGAPRSLGREPMPMQAQQACLDPPPGECGCGALPENRRWMHRTVVFATVHVAGSGDNTGFDARNDREARCRREGNRRWIEEAFARASTAEARALVLFMQANPFEGLRPVYGALVSQLADATRRLRKPVLLVHGDTHTYRVDFPHAGMTRLETFGSPFVAWVKVTVDPTAEPAFRFEPRR